MKLLSACFLLFTGFHLTVMGQSRQLVVAPLPLQQASADVRLVSWQHQACDETYNPYRLVNRITDMYAKEGFTFLTVGFVENCCTTFAPELIYRGDTLFLRSYGEDAGDQCGCLCCFSIEYKIAGLGDHAYPVYFHGRKIERSNDHYNVVEAASEKYKGKQINRLNKYGMREGTWIRFRKDSTISSLEQHPEKNPYGVGWSDSPTWVKTFYPSGALEGYESKDTTQRWFMDGQLKSQSVKYSMGDTLYTQKFSLYEHNRKVANKSLSRYYLTIEKSDDGQEQREFSKTETLYEEAYFDNEQRKYLYGKDSSLSWYPSGRVASITSKEKGIKYYKNGAVSEKSFNWKTEGLKFWNDFDSHLIVKFDRNGQIMKITYDRFEQVSPDGVGQRIDEWVWRKGKLIESPKKWEGPLPWKRFPEIELLGDNRQADNSPINR